MDELRLLLDLVEVPSPSGDEGAACDVFLARATRLGFRAERDAVGNVIATIGSGGPHTMFLGHIDTVPGFWPVRFESGSLSGRGVVDAKGALAAALLAAARLGLDGPGTRTVVAAVGEETDSRGAQHLLRCDPPDALLVGEELCPCHRVDQEPQDAIHHIAHNFDKRFTGMQSIGDIDRHGFHARSRNRIRVDRHRTLTTSHKIS